MEITGTLQIVQRQKKKEDKIKKKTLYLFKEQLFP
jgi:hypothetical protein